MRGPLRTHRRLAQVLLACGLAGSFACEERAEGGDSGGAAGEGGPNTAGGVSSGGATQTAGSVATAGTTQGGGSQAGGPWAGASGATGGAGAGSAGTTSSPSPHVAVDGTRLKVDGKAFRIRGVCWNPVPKGKEHPAGLDFAGLAALDIPLMRAAHVNVVRTYEPLLDTNVLDQLHAAGIYVLDSIYPYGGDAASVVAERVNAVKAHPAILMWLIGNEWNYNGLYVDMSPAAAQARLNEVATLIRAADPSHPIATVYGELPSASVVTGMPEVDIWGINSYRGLSFGDLFDGWRAVSDKPMFLSEFGADAYNATTKAYDPDSQAQATLALIQEIEDHASDSRSDGVALGGTIFEWADEWWKDATGSADAHDIGGIAPGNGPYPDQTFNEEWWGLVDIERKPRPAYDALGAAYAQ